MSMNPPALSSVSPPSGLPPHPLDAEWFIHQDARTYGPYTGRTIRDFVAEGRVTLETVVARVGEQAWTAIREDHVLGGLFGSRPTETYLAPPVVAPTAPGMVAAAAGATVVQVTNNLGADLPRTVLVEDGPAKRKSAGLALLLSFLFCGLGQIYNGQVGKGLLMMVLCVALWFAFLGWIINIWSWIDAYQTASRMNERYQRRLAAGLLV